MKSRWILPLSLLSIQTVAVAAPPPPRFLPDKNRPKIQSPLVSEASGLAISRKSGHFLWTINDSGGTSDIHLLGTDGADRGKLLLTGAPNLDWEDLASFTLDGVSYLLVADTGDNSSKRDTCTLYIVREPKLPGDGLTLETSAAPAWKIDFRYEDGPRDCESVAVDAKAGKIILLSKRTKPPEIYELPLRAPEKRGVITARKLGPTSVDGPAVSLIPFRDQPTSLDITADGNMAAVITYYGIFIFPRKAGETWGDAFARKPESLGPHRLHQAESIAFSSDGKTIYAVSEGNKSPIAKYHATSLDEKSE